MWNKTSSKFFTSDVEMVKIDIGFIIAKCDFINSKGDC